MFHKMQRWLVHTLVIYLFISVRGYKFILESIRPSTIEIVSPKKQIKKILRVDCKFLNNEWSHSIQTICTKWKLYRTVLQPAISFESDVFHDFSFSIIYTNASYYILYIEYVQVARYLQVECEAGDAKDLDCRFFSTLQS